VRIKEGFSGVKVYGSRHPMSKRIGDIGMAKMRRGKKEVECTSLGRQGDGVEVRRLESGGIRD